jgi:hypothetical protein
MRTISNSKGRCRYEMVLIYQPPNAHVRNSRILLSNAMAVAAVKNIYMYTNGIVDWEKDRVDLRHLPWTQKQTNVDLCRLALKVLRS